MRPMRYYTSPSQYVVRTGFEPAIVSISTLLKQRLRVAVGTFTQCFGACSSRHLTIFFCSLVVDSNSRFTILSQQVNALYEFPVSYNHNVLIFQWTSSFFTGVDTLTTFLPPLFLLQRYVLYFNLPNLFQTFFSVVREGLEPSHPMGNRF